MNIFFRMASKKWDRLFQQQLRFIRVVLCTELGEEYKIFSFDDDLEKILAAQVVNYLTGVDIDSYIQNANDETIKIKIGKIKNIVKQSADEKMRNDNEVRKLIVYTLRMDITINSGIHGKKYFSTDEYKRKFELLSKYGSEFSEGLTQKMYMELFEKFSLRFEKIKNKL